MQSDGALAALDQEESQRKAEDEQAASYFYVPERAPEIANFSVTALDTGLFHNNMLSIPYCAFTENDQENGLL